MNPHIPAKPPIYTSPVQNFENRKRDVIVAAIVGIAAYFAFFYILDHYYYGDPQLYQKYYDALFGTHVVSAWALQGPYIGSSEIVYPFVAWICSNSGIERVTAMAGFDGLMYSILYFNLKKYRVNNIYTILFLCNFYIIVLATSAERLKFSYIFLFLALGAVGRNRLIWLGLAPLAHFQSLITEGSILIWHFFSNVSAKIRVVLIAAGVVFGSAAVYFFFDALLAKFSAYQGQGNLLDLLTGLALIGVSAVIFRGKFQVLVAMAPLAILTLILGSSRMNMITFTVFTYVALKEQKTSHPLVLIFMLYLTFKSAEFVRLVLLYGNGFAA